MKQSYWKDIVRMKVAVLFEDGANSVVISPERRRRVGIRTAVGWFICMFGVWLIFGRIRDFVTVINPSDLNWGLKNETD